jgi:hypothetical protein
MSCQILGVTKIHNSYFCSNFFKSSIIFKFDYSTSTIAPIFLRSVIRKKYFTYSSFAEILLKDIFTCRVLFNKMYIFYHLFKLTCRQKFSLNYTLNHLFFKTLRHLRILICIREVQLSNPFLG